MLAELDKLEDYPGWYDRQLQDFNIGMGKKEKAWVYLMKTFPDSMLRLPLLTEYKNTPEKPYKERSLRTISAREDLEYHE